MRRNSNQQGFPSSIKSKRQQFRSQIRREQLEEIFKQKRAELLQNIKSEKKFNEFQSLDYRISQIKSYEDSSEIEREMFDLLKIFPAEDQSFVIMSNFIIKRKDKFPLFQDLILNEQNIKLYLNEYFVGAVGVYAQEAFVLLQSHPRQPECLRFCQRIDWFLAQLIEEFNRNLEITDKSINIFTTYLACFEFQVAYYSHQTFFPKQTLNSIISHFCSFHKTLTMNNGFFVRNVKIFMTQLFLASIQELRKKELLDNETETVLKKQSNRNALTSIQVENLIKSFAIVSAQNLKDVSDYRTRCLQAMQILCQKCPINSGEYLFTKGIMGEMLFLMVEHAPKTTEIILKCFQSTLNSMSNSQLMLFLEQNLHVNLAKVFEKEYREILGSHKIARYSENMHLVLIVIRKLFDKIASIGQARSVNRFIFDMDKVGFSTTFEAMGNIRFNQQIQQEWSYLCDEYFSEDVCCDEEHNENLLDEEYEQNQQPAQFYNYNLNISKNSYNSHNSSYHQNTHSPYDSHMGNQESQNNNNYIQEYEI